MNKLITLYVLMCIFCFHFATINSQNRIILFEDFTNNGCPPCAKYNPGLESAVAENGDKATFITYHGWYPSKDDPMYLADAQEIVDKAVFYFPKGVRPDGFPGEMAFPTYFADGVRVSTGETVNSFYANVISVINRQSYKPSPFKIETNYSLSSDKSKVFVHSKVTAISNISGKMRLFLNVIEEHITDSQALGVNGEKEFFHVLRKILPNSGGLALPAQMAAGETTEFDEEWEIANFYDISELAVVSYIQDIATYEVHQANYTPALPKVNDGANIIEIKNATSELCTPKYTGQLSIMNPGANNLKSAKIHVWINDEEQPVYNWSGDVPYRGYITVNLPVYTNFTLKAAKQTNTIKIKVTNINETTAETSDNYTTIKTVNNTSNSLLLTVYTGGRPQAISWDLKNDMGTIITQEGPYNEKTQLNTIPILLNETSCYTFTFYDLTGNGIGSGYVQLDAIDAAGKITSVFPAITYVGSIMKYNFSVNQILVTGIKTVKDDNISVYPNPSTTGIFNLTGWESSGKVLFSVYNSASIKISEQQLSGNEVETIDLSELTSGIYFLRIQTDNFIECKKLIITK